VTCPTCKGFGYEVDVIESTDGDPPTVEKYNCPDCNGTGERMNEANDLSIGRIVRYTDPAGQPHDAIVDGVVNGKVGIKYRPRITPMSLWVRPESLSIPR
jgi:hypothetical protein